MVGLASLHRGRLRGPPRDRARRGGARGEIFGLARRNCRRPDGGLLRHGADDLPDRRRRVRANARGRPRHRGPRHRVPDHAQLRVPRAPARAEARPRPSRHLALRRRPHRPRRALPVRRRTARPARPGPARHHGARLEAVRRRRGHQPVDTRRSLRSRERVLWPIPPRSAEGLGGAPRRDLDLPSRRHDAVRRGPRVAGAGEGRRGAGDGLLGRALLRHRRRRRGSRLPASRQDVPAQRDLPAVARRDGALLPQGCRAEHPALAPRGQVHAGADHRGPERPRVRVRGL